MKKTHYKIITILGLGQTGWSALNYLKKHYPSSKVQIIDTRKQVSKIDELPEDVALHLGSINQQWLLNSDLIIASPGVNINTVEFDLAKQKGVNIIGDIEFFAQELKRKNMNPKIVAITGSNGKSTVTTLCYDILLANEKHVSVGGNIGTSVLDVIDNNFAYYVLELSSFQLETLKSLKINSAVHLNLSQDHLDRHGSMTSYNNAKQNIYTNAKTTVYNADDAQTKPNKFYFTKKKISFGVNNADYYLRDYNGVTYLMYKQQKLLSENNLKLVGKHNMLNILACLALLEPLKLNQNKTLQAIKNFAGLEHRCQLVHFANDVKWIDDSKATNVGSVIAALDGLKVSNKLFILMGGDAKGANLTPLKAYLDKFDHELYCFGKDKKQLAKLSKNSHEYETMVEAIANLTPHTKAGDVVLLSPACASIDQFENYKQRGQIFADLAKKVSI